MMQFKECNKLSILDKNSTRRGGHGRSRGATLARPVRSEVLGTEPSCSEIWAMESSSYGGDHVSQAPVFPTRRIKPARYRNPDDPDDDPVKTFSKEQAAMLGKVGNPKSLLVTSSAEDREAEDRKRRQCHEQLVMLKSKTNAELDKEIQEQDMKEWLDKLSIRSTTKPSSSHVPQSSNSGSSSSSGSKSLMAGAVAKAAIRMKIGRNPLNRRGSEGNLPVQPMLPVSSPASLDSPAFTFASIDGVDILKPIRELSELVSTPSTPARIGLMKKSDGIKVKSTIRSTGQSSSVNKPQTARPAANQMMVTRRKKLTPPIAAQPSSGSGSSASSSKSMVTYTTTTRKMTSSQLTSGIVRSRTTGSISSHSSGSTTTKTSSLVPTKKLSHPRY